MGKEKKSMSDLYIFAVEQAKRGDIIIWDENKVCIENFTQKISYFQKE